jgi:phenylpropionate dioxygenase-like ring-hydroxylating dioxygenase large terminal subunit
MAGVEISAATGSFGAYERRGVPEEDQELTHVGPGTPGGEYLRRYWQPVSLSSNLKDLPVPVMILGEELVLFREGQGRVGLLPLHCSHRGTSLEFGTIERRGIRCCYHGWLYDTAGRVLETPGEPADSPLPDRIHHGAYPTVEYEGLVFAYMGPLAERPAFPTFDTFAMPGYRLRPNGSRYVSACNWLQLKENCMDPAHAVFLHGMEEARARLDEHRPSVHSERSLDDYFTAQTEYEADLESLRDHYRERVVEWQESPVGMISIHTQRVDDLVYVRVGDFIPPNIHQFPPTWYQVEGEEHFRPPTGVQWAVPVDDTHTVTFGYSYVREDRRSARDIDNRPHTLRTSDSITRSYEERQRAPGDYEAQESQRPIAVHRLEHLATTDAGVIMARKLIRDGIRAVQQEKPLRQPKSEAADPIPTYCQITVRQVARGRTPEEERAILRDTGRDVARGHRLQAMQARGV